MHDLHVILGCFGLRVDDFVNCKGIENTILKLNSQIVNYNEILDYCDQCRLFDRPMFDINAVKHFVFNLQNRFNQVVRPLWLPKKFELYQKFIIEHRHCGVYVKLQLAESQPVKAEPLEEVVHVPANKFRLIRNS